MLRVNEFLEQPSFPILSASIHAMAEYRILHMRACGLKYLMLLH